MIPIEQRVTLEWRNLNFFVPVKRNDAEAAQLGATVTFIEDTNPKSIVYAD